MLIAALILGAYLLGAVPFGLLIGLARGVDVRRHGSGNIGATNVGRVVGRQWGYACLVLDVLKGWAPTAVAGALIDHSAPGLGPAVCWLAVGLAAVLGHVFPVYLGFRGGKGVATSIGMALGIYPFYTMAIGVALLGYAVVRGATGAVAPGSLTLAVLFPVGVYVSLRLFGADLTSAWPFLAVAIGVGALIIVRHESNIRRLLQDRQARRGR